MNPIASGMFVIAGLLGFVALALSMWWHKLDTAADMKFEKAKQIQRDQPKSMELTPGDVQDFWDTAYVFRRRVDWVRFTGQICLYLSFGIAFLALVVQGLIGLS